MAIIQNDPVYSLPFLYKYGLMISNDPTTPNSLLDIGAGQCRDSNDIMDIGVGTTWPNLNGGTVNTPLIVSNLLKGAGGLDTGTVAASTMYAIYVIADSRYYQPTAGIATLASNASPLIPFGYDSYRLIGYWSTNASSQWNTGYYSGLGSVIQFTYDAPQVTSVTAGASTAYAPVVLTTLVPPIQNTPVVIYSNFIPAAASDLLSLQIYNGVGAQVTVIGQVAAIHVASYNQVLAGLNAGVPTINYKVSSGTDSVAIDVSGFTVYLS